MRQNNVSGAVVAAAGPTVIRTEISEAAALVLSDADGLTPNDRQFLKDIQQIEKYPARWLARLAQLARQCRTEAAAYALVEKLRAFVRVGRPRPQLTLRVAIEQETIAQANADVEEMRAGVAHNDLGALVRCERSLIQHRAAIDNALEAVQVRRMELLGAVS